MSTASAGVLYEMIGGQPPHSGPSAQSILVHILTEEAKPLSKLRHTVPPNVAATVAKSIEKLPADRFETAKAFMEALEDEGFTYQCMSRDTSAEPDPVTVPSSAGPAGSWNRLTVGLATMAAVLGGLAAWGWLSPAPELPVTRASIDLGDVSLNVPGEVLVSPDGLRLALVWLNGPGNAIYWRNADEEDFQPIAGTEGATYGSFSPDGRSLVFGAETGMIQRVAISGGAPQPVAVLTAEGGTATLGGLYWGDDGNIVFTLSGGRGLFRVPASGGDPEVLLEESTRVRNPRLLPGGGAVIFTDPTELSTFVFDVETDSVRLVRSGAVDAAYVETGHLVYADVSGTLWAAAFDPDAAEVVGEPSTILDRLIKPQPFWARFSISESGTLVYGLGVGAAGPGGFSSELMVVSLDGDERVLSLPPRAITGLRWSPDGESVAYSGTDAGRNQDPPMIFVYNVELATAPRRLTVDGSNFSPVWSPDGAQIAFAIDRPGTTYDLFSKALDDAPPELLFAVPGRQIPNQWLEDDRLVFSSGTSPAQNNTWLMQVPDSATAGPYFPAEGNHTRVAVSPDGELAAYESDESGQFEIYVRSFPEPRQQSPVSNGGGQFARWSPDGGTIYYWREGAGPAPDSLFAATVEREPTFAVLSREFVLAGDYASPDWDLHPDGDRFIVPRIVGAGAAAGGGTATADRERYLIVTNWFTELLAAVGEGN